MRRVVFVALALLLGGCSGGTGRWSVPAGAPSPLPSIEASPLPPFDTNEDRIVQVARRVSPAVVSVTSNFGSGGESVAQGEGTGFVIDAQGVVVTNFHVVENGVNLRVVTAGGENLSARVIGGDPDADLAILQVEAESPLPVVSLGSSRSLELGQPVVALGFALGLEGGPSVTSGIVSAKERSIRAGGAGSPTRLYEGLIQTDAAINPGNSGGPLVDLNGRVVGINTAGVQAASAENIGFAIAIDRAKSVIRDAVEDPEAAQAYMGVSTRNITAALAAQLGLPVTEGALVVEVVPGGPSDRGGVVAGDVIIEIAGEEIGSAEDISEALADLEPDQEVEVVVVTAEGAERSLTVVLGTRALPVPQG